MFEWQIKTVIFNGNHETDFIVRAEGLSQTKQQVLKEIKKMLPQRKNLYLEAKHRGVYTIVSYMDDVGEVSLQRKDPLIVSSTKGRTTDMH